MNWDIAKGNWKQMQGEVKRQWGKLTDDDLTRIEGDRDRLVGSVQERYGVAKDDADRQVRDWEARDRPVDDPVRRP
ncbi:MAG TPA: CsbD family protein [Paracoccaceae bacterium]|nr:CsbD family protein [Paracoccaceae bacterium]